MQTVYQVLWATTDHNDQGLTALNSYLGEYNDGEAIASITGELVRRHDHVSTLILRKEMVNGEFVFSVVGAEGKDEV